MAALLIVPLAARAQDSVAKAAIPPLVRDYKAISRLTTYDDVILPPKEIIAAAFGTEYGRALVAELGEILADTADKACIQSKNLGPADFARHAGEIYQRYGTRILETFHAMVGAAADAAMKARMPSLDADLAELRDDPDVKKLIALEAPTRF